VILEVAFAAEADPLDAVDDDPLAVCGDDEQALAVSTNMATIAAR
jgi:hypothetical protein